MTDIDDMLARRRDVARLAIEPLAFSSDGRTVGFVGPVELGLDVGGLATIDLPDGASLVVQVRDLTVVEREGRAIEIDVSDVVPSASNASVRPVFHSIAGSAVVVARIDDAGVSALRSAEPFSELRIRPVSSEQAGAVSVALDGDVPLITIGKVAATNGPAHVRAAGFARHTFMCGQSGSGKTYTTGVLFERLLAETSLPILVLDPNSDHVHLGSLREPTDTSPEAQHYREVARSVTVARARGLDATHTLCADFSDLDLDVQARLLRLDPIADLDGYAALRQVTGRLGDTYSISELATLAGTQPETASLATRIDNLRLADWALWRRPDEASVASVDVSGSRCIVLDLGSLARPDERTTVALAVLGRRWGSRALRRPVLIAVDEAHNIFPAVTDDPLREASAELGVLIAGEGRKFGLHLFVATQRPGKVHPNVVSQCDNLILMRMNGTTDIEEMTSLFSHVPAQMLRSSVGFGLGQALVAGPIAPLPMVVQIGARQTPEGGGDVATTWTARPHASDGTDDARHG